MKQWCARLRACIRPKGGILDIISKLELMVLLAYNGQHFLIWSKVKRFVACNLNDSFVNVF